MCAPCTQQCGSRRFISVSGLAISYCCSGCHFFSKDAHASNSGSKRCCSDGTSGHRVESSQLPPLATRLDSACRLGHALTRVIATVNGLCLTSWSVVVRGCSGFTVVRLRIIIIIIITSPYLLTSCVLNWYSWISDESLGVSLVQVVFTRPM